MIAKNKDGVNVDFADIINFSLWLGVLAAPHLYRTIKRQVDPRHLTSLMDIWVAYVERGDCYWDRSKSTLKRLAQRAPLARKLRALIAAWTPPGLPAEITETARALLDAEGLSPPNGRGWDELEFDFEGDPMEDMLPWPEGIPARLRREKTGRDCAEDEAEGGKGEG